MASDKELTQSAAADRLRLAELFEFAPIALLLTDDSGIICEANRHSARLLQCTRQSLLQQPIASLIHRRAQVEFVEQLTRARHRREQCRWESVLWAIDERGERVTDPNAGRAAVITAESAASPILLAGRKEPTNYIRWSIQDISDLSIAKAALAKFTRGLADMENARPTGQ